MSVSSVGYLMPFPRLRSDLALLREGAEVAVGFGIRSVAGLGEVAEFIAGSIYERGSLHSTGQGIGFVLRNPPLRMGAFSSIRVAVDGRWADPAAVSVQPGPTAAAVRLDHIDRQNPVTLPTGSRTYFQVFGGATPGHRATVRLELRSVAIPPLVWFEFSDEVQAARTPA